MEDIQFSPVRFFGSSIDRIKVVILIRLSDEVDTKCEVPTNRNLSLFLVHVILPQFLIPFVLHYEF